MKEIHVAAKLENLDQIIEMVDEDVSQYACSPTAAALIKVAVDEIFTNIASYAYKDKNGGDEAGLVDVSITSEPDPPCIELRFADSGVPFDPLKVPEPDTTLAADERQIGGLGIFMTKQIMDEISYSYENGKNVLVIRKKLADDNEEPE